MKKTQAKNASNDIARDRAATVSERVEAQLVAAALRKAQAGQQPSLREMSALRRFEKHRNEQLRWEHYRTVPARHYAEMSGRQHKVLNEQAKLHGIPCAGSTIDLCHVIRWLHDFLAKNSHRLDGDAVRESDEGDAALARKRIAEAEMAEIEVARIRGTVVAKSEAIEAVATLAARAVRVMDILENTIATEFEMWIADPVVREVPAEDRMRAVRDFVRKTCREVRQAEADGAEKELKQAQANQAAGT